MESWDIEGMTAQIKQMRLLAEELELKGKGIKAVERNIFRILASIRILELNISDISSGIN